MINIKDTKRGSSSSINATQNTLILPKPHPTNPPNNLLKKKLTPNPNSIYRDTPKQIIVGKKKRARRKFNQRADSDGFRKQHFGG